MPSRKKKQSFRNVADAKRMRLNRSQDSDKDREVKLTAIRARQVRTLVSEMPTHREYRLSMQRFLTVYFRSQETLEEREGRLTADREPSNVSLKVFYLGLPDPD